MAFIGVVGDSRRMNAPAEAPEQPALVEGVGSWNEIYLKTLPIKPFCDSMSTISISVPSPASFSRVAFILIALVQGSVGGNDKIHLVQT